MGVLRSYRLGFFPQSSRITSTRIKCMSAEASRHCENGLIGDEPEEIFTLNGTMIMLIPRFMRKLCSTI